MRRKLGEGRWSYDSQDRVRHESFDELGGFVFGKVVFRSGGGRREMWWVCSRCRGLVYSCLDTIG